MTMRKMLRSGRGVVAALAITGLLQTGVLPVGAATAEGLAVSTPFPSVQVEPGGDVTFPIDVSTAAPETVGLAVTAAPEGFQTTLRGGGFIVSSVYTGTAEPSGAEPLRLELQVTVPEETAPGPYDVNLQATGADGRTTDLPLGLTVNEVAAGSVTLDTEVPSVRGDSSQTFSFSLTLSNDTAQEVTFGLEAAGEPGWDITPTFSGEALAATSVVAAGETATVDVGAVAPEGVPAGAYPLVVRATGGSYTAEAPLQVEITGSYAMSISTADGRLNATVTGGGSTTLPIVVTNDGTAELTDVSLSASPPGDWEVAFEPSNIASIPVGNDVTVTATITTAGNAVAGDYQWPIDADSADASDSIELRTTVETSSIWGFVGLALIAVVIAGLFFVFRRYGRR